MKTQEIKVKVKNLLNSDNLIKLWGAIYSLNTSLSKSPWKGDKANFEIISSPDNYEHLLFHSICNPFRVSSIEIEIIHGSIGAITYESTDSNGSRSYREVKNSVLRQGRHTLGFTNPLRIDGYSIILVTISQYAEVQFMFRTP